MMLSTTRDVVSVPSLSPALNLFQFFSRRTRQKPSFGLALFQCITSATSWGESSCDYSPLSTALINSLK